jgi:transcriptional regulator GlxA family with amidase domain
VQFGIFIYDGVEPIDLATFGVLSMARRIAPEIAIHTIAPRAGPVALANGLKVTADFGIDDAPACDLVIVTGGPGWTAQAKAPATLEYIRRVHASRRIASVCTGGRPRAACWMMGPPPPSARWCRRKLRRSN